MELYQDARRREIMIQPKTIFMKCFCLLLVAAVLLQKASGQSAFFPAVKVEFEKVVYVKQLVKERESEWYERVKDELPEKVVSYADFTGDTSKTIYKPGREIAANGRMSWYTESAMAKNTVFTDFTHNRIVAQKPVFEETFLIQDSMLHIKWKLTADTRTIAGFDCRKAVGTIDDSVIIFAFYTDEILIKGGPETAQGLPGMILGLGIPRLHTTWFATKVEVKGINTSAIIPATKGKKVTRQTLMQSLDNVLKNWGDYGKKMRFDYII
jgi:GLPGLI family protein